MSTLPGQQGIPPTFGPCEKQLIRGIQAKDGLGVALGHGDALQWGRACALGASDRCDDAPSGRERQGTEPSAGGIAARQLRANGEQGREGSRA